MRIDILTVGGSPRGIIPSDIWGNGVGGAEKFGMELFSRFAKLGHSVNVYNDPKAVGNHDGVNYLPHGAFTERETDILITFRGNDPRNHIVKAKKKIAISTDQFTIGDYPTWYNEVDEFIGISQFHKEDHLRRYGNIAQKMKVFDIGTDVKDYEIEIEKKPYQVIFCSVPDRGLNVLADYWNELKEKIPQLELVVTSSYALWNGGQDEGNFQYRMRMANMNGVRFLGRIPRRDLIKYQLESEAQLYPNIYDENFCISVSECAIAGAYPITSNKGALSTTNFTDGRIDFDPTNDLSFRTRFIDKTMEYFSKPIEERKTIQSQVSRQARERFSWNNIMKEWEKLLDV